MAFWAQVLMSAVGVAMVDVAVDVVGVGGLQLVPVRERLPRVILESRMVVHMDCYRACVFAT